MSQPKPTDSPPDAMSASMSSGDADRIVAATLAAGWAANQWQSISCNHSKMWEIYTKFLDQVRAARQPE